MTEDLTDACVGGRQEKEEPNRDVQAQLRQHQAAPRNVSAVPHRSGPPIFFQRHVNKLLSFHLFTLSYVYIYIYIYEMFQQYLIDQVPLPSPASPTPHCHCDL